MSGEHWCNYCDAMTDHVSSGHDPGSTLALRLARHRMHHYAEDEGDPGLCTRCEYPPEAAIHIIEPDVRGMAQAIRLNAGDLDAAEAMLREYLARAWDEGLAVESDALTDNPYAGPRVTFRVMDR